MKSAEDAKRAGNIAAGARGVVAVKSADLELECGQPGECAPSIGLSPDDAPEAEGEIERPGHQAVCTVVKKRLYGTLRRASGLPSSSSLARIVAIWAAYTCSLDLTRLSWFFG